MPFNLPTLADKRGRARALLAARIPGADLTPRRGVLPAIADTTADLSYDEILFLRWMLDQLFADTAELPYLIRTAAIVGIARKGASTSAGPVVFAGQPGIDIPAGTPLQTTDGTAAFVTSSDLAIAAGASTGTVTVTSTTAGAIGNLDPGTTLNLAVGVAGIQATATVGAGGLTGGQDAETAPQLLQRYLARIQQPPQGGDAQDYVQWAEQVPGVTRAWSYPRNRGTGTIDVAFVLDGRTNIIPTATDVAAVQANLDLRRPAVGDCQAFVLTPDPVTVSLTQCTFASGITAAAGQAAIAQSLMTLFAAATPGGVTVVGPGVSAAAPAGLVELSQVNIAIAATTGVVRYELLSPTADLQSGQGHIPVLAGVSFQ